VWCMLTEDGSSSGHARCWLSSVTLYVAAVGAAWSLLGSLRSRYAVLYLFQKHLLCWDPFIAAATVDVFGSDGRHLLVRAQCFTS
jgi:hypothetical protein